MEDDIPYDPSAARAVYCALYNAVSMACASNPEDENIVYSDLRRLLGPLKDGVPLHAFLEGRGYFLISAHTGHPSARNLYRAASSEMARPVGVAVTDAAAAFCEAAAIGNVGDLLSLYEFSGEQANPVPDGRIRALRHMHTILQIKKDNVKKRNPDLTVSRADFVPA